MIFETCADRKGTPLLSDRKSAVILVRHGVTDAAGSFCGQSDPDLNVTGERQAEDIAESLVASGIQAVYSSDLRRAYKTAASIARRCCVPHLVSMALREISFGQWEGLRWGEIESRFPHDARIWSEQFPNRSAPGGEAFQQFSARVLKEINPIMENASGPVCVVSHGGVMRVILTGIFNFDTSLAWTLTKDYGCIVEIGGHKDEHCHQKGG